MGDNDSDSSDSAWSSSSDMSGSGASSDAGSSRIEEEELEFLRNATPLRDEKLWEIQNWSQTGFYTRDSGSRWIKQEIVFSFCYHMLIIHRERINLHVIYFL